MADRLGLERFPLLGMGRAIASESPGARFVPLKSRNHILVDHEPAWEACLENVERFLAENGI